MAEIIKWNENVTFHYVPSNQFKSNLTGILLRAPLERGTVTQNALLAQILKSATENFPTPAVIAKHLAEMYGSIFDLSIVKKGNEQILFLYMESIGCGVQAEKLYQQNADFIHEILFRPACTENSFPAELVAREKEVLREKIKNQIEDKKEYARNKCIETMFAQKGFGIYAEGYEEDLDQITGEMLWRQYKALLDNAPIAVLFSGCLGREVVEKTLKETLPFSDRKRDSLPKTAEGNDRRQEIKKRQESMDILQAKLCVGFRTDKKPYGREFFSMLVMNEIFGGGASSKLFNTIREKEGLCYYVNTILYRFPMILILQAGIEASSADKVAELAKTALSEIEQGSFSDEEFENAKETVCKQYENIADYQASALDFHVTQYLLGAKENLQEFQEQIKKVEKKEVCESAAAVKMDTIYLISAEEAEK